MTLGVSNVSLNFHSISAIFTGNHSSTGVCFNISSFCLVFLVSVLLLHFTVLLSYACTFVMCE